ncbi:GntR family transcriptional regulator [Candidatus Formimonas warabiya]|uniref:HTH gntR-type domain-containing protein n=1 Tax=Formimonas warabiya TaxID=1761012 RepID=A0A3G1KR65_FORW1|nr:GntR family transcriptional regulator [Candidatus Formimonas warabiya]ATW24963.1 hypothetical protein DCMF_09420 [Candidatus Formimonas warabiya]
MTKILAGKDPKIKNLTNVAYETIKNSIVNNDLKPGDHLSEHMIAASLGMSRTPIREALKVLANEGLVEIHNGVGIFVKHMTAKEIYEFFEVRAALECAALHTSLKNITDHEIEQIEQEWLSLRDKADQGQRIDFDLIAELDRKLHMLIVNKCNNEYLKSIINGIRQSIFRYQRLSAQALGNEKESINQHLEILSLLKERNMEKILPVLDDHIRKGADNVARNA